MQSRFKWWLIGIIALVILAFLVVMRPITLERRINPDTGKKYAPVARVIGLNIYKPHPDIRLGLDLRGGMQLRLQLQKKVNFAFNNINELRERSSDEERNNLQAQIGEALTAAKLDQANRTITVNEDNITVSLPVKEQNDIEKLSPIVAQAIQKFYPNAMMEKPEFIELKAGQLEEVMSNLESRINAYGVSEAIFQAEPPDKILVEMPGVKDPKQATALLQDTASLEFKGIPSRYVPSEPVINPKTGEEEIKTFNRKRAGGMSDSKPVDSRYVLDQSETLLTGQDLKNNARVVIQAGQPTAVTMSFKGKAIDKWAEYTASHQNNSDDRSRDRFVAIVLDGRIISCPKILNAIPNGDTQISGGFDGPDGTKQANALKIKLNAGALPVGIVPVEQREVSATLGADSLRASLIAGGAGLILIVIFMIFYYKLPGLLACVALGIYGILVLGVLKAFDATLTLPGIFGFILSVGMAVDANVIIFERLKEELCAGKTLRGAIEAGFKRAWTAILDSNVCSILTGLVLYWLGTGPVKGFAVTLIIGVAVSLFTAVTVTQLFMDITAETKLSQRPSLFGVSEESLAEAR